MTDRVQSRRRGRGGWLGVGRPAAILALAAAVALSACGDGDGSATGGAATSSATSSATTTSSPSTTTSGDPGCSAAGMVVDATQEALPAVVAQKRGEIAAAAARCDYEALAGATAATFTFTFGAEDDPAEFWADSEAAGEDVLGTLVGLLNLEPATVDAGDSKIFVWPAAFAYDSWSDIPEDERSALLEVYEAEDLESFARFGSYVGYRVGIDASGRWIYFVAGD